MKTNKLIELLLTFHNLSMSKKIEGCETPQGAFDYAYKRLNNILAEGDLVIAVPTLDYNTVFDVVKDVCLYETQFDGDRVPIKITNEILLRLRNINAISEQNDETRH